MTKAQRIKEYNLANPSYFITGIKKCSKEQLNWARVNNAKSLDELYKSCSYAKRASWQIINRVYKPSEIIGLQGSSMTYSATFVAENGDTLWITRGNNYLVEVV